MKLRALILTAILGACAWASDAGNLARVKSVYFFPMANGFDQYLANRVTRGGIFEVVADPKAADAVFSDQLGAPFEARLDEVAPNKPPVAEKEDEKKKEDKKEAAGALGDTKSTGAVASSTFRRGKGMVFLVDVKTRRVIWSAYERPKSTSPAELDRTAGRLAKELHSALKPKPAKNEPAPAAEKPVTPEKK